jgi:predicted nucleic acid-binding protein
MRLMLDTSVLLKLCHPTSYGDVKDWFRTLLERGDDAPEIIISVLADYELRRALVAANALGSLQQLDEIARSLRQVPLTTEATRKATELRHGYPGTKAPPDADVLMAAQAALEDAILVTSDRDLLDLPGIAARDWHQISVD